jgi:hypothetical protein
MQRRVRHFATGRGLKTHAGIRVTGTREIIVAYGLPDPDTGALAAVGRAGAKKAGLLFDA